MNTFRNKYFKNSLDPQYAFYDCLGSCELKTTSKNDLEKCFAHCEFRSLPKNLDR